MAITVLPQQRPTARVVILLLMLVLLTVPKTTAALVGGFRSPPHQSVSSSLQWRTTTTTSHGRPRQQQLLLPGPCRQPWKNGSLLLSPRKPLVLTALPTSDVSDPVLITTLSSLAAEDTGEDWRQYVPLVVSVSVIIDILLGSPAANAVLSLVRSQEETASLTKQPDTMPEETKSSPNLFSNLNPMSNLPFGGGGGGTTATSTKKKERVDSESMAQAALERAALAAELAQQREKASESVEALQSRLQSQMDQVDEKIDQLRQDNQARQQQQQQQSGQPQPDASSED